MSIRDLKHAALLQEWSGRIAECRSSGKSVKEWCAAQGIVTKTYYYWEKQFVTEASRQQGLVSTGSESLVRVDPGILGSRETDATVSGIAIRHGRSVITLPVGSNMEAVADLVRALNSNA